MNLLKWYDASRVTRFHTLADYSGRPKQNLAEHSWGVAMFCLQICETLGRAPTVELLRTALVHDLAESVVGDVPTTAKWRFPDLRKMLHACEREVSIDLDLDLPPLSDLEAAILKWADILELYTYASKVGFTSVVVNVEKAIEVGTLLPSLEAGLVVYKTLKGAFTHERE